MSQEEVEAELDEIRDEWVRIHPRMIEARKNLDAAESNLEKFSWRGDVPNFVFERRNARIWLATATRQLVVAERELANEFDKKLNRI